MKKNRGFTLIEIGIVLFVVGILLAVFIPSFTQGIRDKGAAQRIVTQSRQIIQDAIQIAQSCNLSNNQTIKVTRVTNISNIGGMAYSIVLASGMSEVANAYKYCVNQANLNLAKYKLSQTPPLLKVEGTPYLMDIVGGSNNISTSTLNVPYDVVVHVISQLDLNVSDFPMGTMGTLVSKTIGSITFTFYDFGSGTAMLSFSASDI